MLGAEMEAIYAVAEGDRRQGGGIGWGGRPRGRDADRCGDCAGGSVRGGVPVPGAARRLHRAQSGRNAHESALQRGGRADAAARWAPGSSSGPCVLCPRRSDVPGPRPGRSPSWCWRSGLWAVSTVSAVARSPALSLSGVVFPCPRSPRPRSPPLSPPRWSVPPPTPCCPWPAAVASPPLGSSVWPVASVVSSAAASELASNRACPRPCSSSASSSTLWLRSLQVAAFVCRFG